MINADMRYYDYYLYEDDNGYGQSVLSEKPKGKIKININTSSQYVQDNILYQKAEFVGLTREPLSDKYVIQYEDIKLKVTFVTPKGRLKQVFMTRI